MLLVFSFASEQERDKFEFIYQKYKNLLLQKAYGILGDYSLAEDAVSEAYIRIYKNLQKIGDPTSGQSIAFVVTIAKNAALTMLAKEKRNVAGEYDEDQPDSGSLEEDVLAALGSERIRAALGGLSEELHSVFLLKYAYDYSHRDIGEILGISENNVTVRLHRAKKKLAELLVKEGYARG